MWNVLGWICVGLGAVGVVMPILPTVPFVIMAAFCFERGSPTLHRWLMEHKTFGPSLKQWRYHRVIRPRAKAMAVICISCSVFYVLYFRDFSPWLKGVVASCCFCVVIFILVQRNHPPSQGGSSGV